MDVGISLGLPVMLLTLAYKAPGIAQDLVIGTHMTTSAGILNSAKQIMQTTAAILAATTGTGAGAVAAMSLAKSQMGDMKAAGTAPGSAAGRAATVARLTAQNAASGVASDVGKRMSGSYAASHGHIGWRIAQDLNNRKNG
jgi:type IV secretory pathway TrbL component